MRRILIIGLFLFFSSTAHAFCFEEAAGLYNLSPVLLRGIAQVESNFNPSAVNHNKNGSYDYGLMQINSFWAPYLGNLWDALSDPCYNVKVGSWILSQCVQRYGNTWKAVGCYNANSPEKRINYANKVYQVLNK